MKSEIATFLATVCKPLGLTVDYMTNDRWIIHKEGRIIQGFSTKTFFSIPKRERMNMFEPLLKIGLTNNLGSQAVKNQLFMERRVGKRITT